MKQEQILIGDIRKCTKHEYHTTFGGSTYIGNQCIDEDSFGYIEEDNELYKKDAILIKIKNGGYVDLENLNSFLNYIKILKDIKKDGFILSELMMGTSAYCKDCLFVDNNSLRPYYTEKQQPKSIHKLKKMVKQSR